jgi:molybdate transport repressor ModE-like protein
LGWTQAPLMIDARRLRVLREVAQHGSFSAAAQVLSFSQPAVSNQIARLEAETGAQLVERTRRGVRLTEAGQLLAKHADAVLNRLAVAEAELQELLDVRRGRLRLGAFPSAFVSLVPGAVAEFRDRHPAVELALSEVGLEEAVDRLTAGDLDLAVVFRYDVGGSAGIPSELLATPLIDDPMYLVLAGDHPLAARRQIRIEDLAGESWIQATRGPSSHAIYDAWRRVGFEPRIVFETDDLMAVQGLVAAGVAFTLLPALALESLRDDLVVRSLGNATPIRHVLALSLAAYRSAAASAMLAILERGAADARGESASAAPAGGVVDGEPEP